MQYFQYTGTFTGVPMEEINRYSSALVENANIANQEYDLVNNYLSTIQATDDSERNYLNSMKDQLNGEIAKIAKDANGNIKWHTATAAVRNLRRKFQLDQGLQSIKTNYGLFTEYEKAKATHRAAGRIPLEFNTDFQGVTYDENGNPNFNRFAAFVEPKGDWQDEYNKRIWESKDIDLIYRMRDLYNKKDTGTLTPEEQLEFDTKSTQMVNTAANDAGSNQHQRYLMQQYQDENKVKDHVINNQLRHSIFAKTPAEFEYESAMAQAGLQSQQSAATPDSNQQLADNLITIGQPGFSTTGQNVKSDISNSYFDENGNLTKGKLAQKVLSQDEFNKLSADEKQKYKQVNVGGRFGIGYQLSNEQYRNELENKIEKRRQILNLDSSIPAKEVQRQWANVENTSQNLLLNTFDVRDENLRSKLIVSNKDDLQSQIGDFKDAYNGKDTNFLDKLYEESNGKITHSTFLGFVGADESVTGYEQGSAMYQITFESKNKNEEPVIKTVVLPTSKKDKDFKHIFNNAASFQKKFYDVEYSNSVNPSPIYKTDKNIIKYSDVSDNKNAKDVNDIWFQPVKYVVNGQPQMILKSVAEVGGKIVHLDNYFIDTNNEVKINPDAIARLRSQGFAVQPIQELLNDPANRQSIKEKLLVLQRDAKLPDGQRDINYDFMLQRAKYKLASHPYIQNAANTPTMSAEQVKSVPK